MVNMERKNKSTKLQVIKSFLDITCVVFNGMVPQRKDI